VDATAMQLVLNPYQFDVLVMENMFGDILSDEIAGLVGGLGLAPGGNIGKDAAIFEPVHGSAPDIAGKGVANPGAMILAAAMLLDHIGELEKATRIREALYKAVNAGKNTTPDLKGNGTTNTFAEAIASYL
jgi:isocitrate dehydrogenase (NAD+)